MSVTNSPRLAKTPAASRELPLAGPDSLSGHTDHGPQSMIAAEGHTSPPPTRPPAPKRPAAAGPDSLSGHRIGGTHSRPAAEGTASPQAIQAPASTGQSPAGTETVRPATDPPAPKHSALAGPSLADPLLALAADVLSDLETVRIANENRLRQLTRSVEDSDGEMRGFGLDETHPDVARLAALVAMLAQAEHQATLNLQRLMRAHPLGPWLKGRKGIGDKQGARLLAAIGDPYIRPEITREDGTVEPSRPRLVSELWAYCGYHVIRIPASHNDIGTQVKYAGGDPGSYPSQSGNGTQGRTAGVAARKRKGEHANWSPAARMRAHLVAESCIKQMGPPYRAVYDATRAKYANAIHSAGCAQCGPKGKPAQPGTPLSAGHQHARALRAVAKEVLRDLWREARRLHQETASSQLSYGTHALVAAGGSLHGEGKEAAS